MNIILKNNLRLSNVPSELRTILVQRLEFANPKWIENARMSRWNRGTPKTLKFYDKIKGGGLWIPRGYMRQLILLCRRHKISFQIEDKRRNLKKTEFSFAGQLKPFQKEAVDKMLSKEFGTLSSPTGSGKTVMALFIISQRSQPALIVVHTKELAVQWINRVETFLKIPASEVGFIGGGNKKIGKQISVALVQSLYKCALEVSQYIGNLVVDECHRAPSRTFTEAVTEFDSKYMLGLSATPYRRDKLSKLIFWHIGDVHYEVDRNHLIQTGDVLPVSVVTRETDFKPYFDPVNQYSKMLSELTMNDKRNHLIAADVAKETLKERGVCLVLSDRKKHCETLLSLLKYKHKISAEILTGSLSAGHRQKVIDRLNQGKVKVLIATGQLIGEGFDCKNLSTLFLSTPIRFSGRVVQYLGRILRPAPGKEKARLFDYVDINVEPLKNAAKARQKVYKASS
ncbi:MAG: DEAD/DEAH box helicase [Deltaproteobacteria bacterium]|nr:DEAD/DEAH box helicase [Deltaproteobacteria bacterium]